MSTGAPSELTASGLIEKIKAEDVPHDFVVMAARGFLPLAQDELIQVLLFLVEYADPEIGILAKGSLEDVPPAELESFAKQCTEAEMLDRLAVVARDRVVVETVLRNRSTSDDTFLALARTSRGQIQEVIVTNQERVIRTPAILDALLENPELIPDVRRRVLETREEFFDKVVKRDERRAAERALIEAEVELTREQQEELDDLVAKAEQDETEGPSLAPPDRVSDDEDLSVWNQILKMTVAEKVQLAFKAGRTERGILVRDRNKLVCTAVVRNPRISESEVEAIAGMRNIEGEVLRLVAANREWMRKYPIMSTLIKNPKTPIAVTLPLVTRLNTKDLRSLGIDKGVPEALRTTARRLFLAKTQGFKSP